MSRLLLVAVTATIYMVWGVSIWAQTGISTINTSNVGGTTTTTLVTAPSDAGNSIVANAQYNINYGQGNNVKVTSYVVSGTTYDRFLSPDTLILNRRITNDRLVNIWYQLNQINTAPAPDELDIDPDIVPEADAIYLSGNLNAGYDNILVNDDDLAGGSIQVETERVDVVWFSGIQTSDPTTAVFPVIERGGNDNIAIAAITSLNPDGTPATYGTLVGIASTDWPGTGSTFSQYVILRRQAVGDDPIPLIEIGSQIVQGVAVSFTELGVSTGQSIFGYSLFASDVEGTGGAPAIASGVDLSDITTYPTNTLSSVSGLDLVAGVSAAVASDDNLIETVGPGGYKDALATWLKANDGAFVSSGGAASTEGASVGFWEDQSVGNHDFTTLSTAPTFRSSTSSINFNPSVDFINGTETGLQVPDNADYNNGGPYTRKSMNFAFRTSSDVTTRQQLFEQGGGGNGLGIYIDGGTIYGAVWNRSNSGSTGAPWNNSTPTSFVSTTINTSTEYIVTLEFDGSSSLTGTVTVYLNGQSFGTLSSVGLLYNHTNDIGLGDVDGNSRYHDNTTSATSFRGEISEFIYCNEPAALVLSQRRRIESYLAIKYGITLDQSTPIDYLNSDGTIIFDATNNASIGGYLEYNNDIAGIGRDDNSELDQPASRSENTGSVVTIDHGTSIGTDDSWLIWGNDGAALTETAALTSPDTIDLRINRVWRVAERNEVQTTSVSFDLASLGLSSNEGDFSLLIASNSSNADFSNATVLTGGTLVGDVITFSGVDLDDGEYFTLGTNYFECSPGGVETNLALWLKADEGTGTSVDGTDIETWTDKSTGGNDATAVSGNEPSYVANSINFNPALDFDDANTEEIAGAAGFHSVAYYMVVNPDDNLTSASTNQVALGFGPPAGATDEFGALAFGSVTGAFADEVVTHAIGGSGTRWRRGISSTNISQINSGQTYLFGIRDNGASATTTNMFVDGLEQADLIEGGGTFLTSVDEDYEVGSYTAANAFTTTGHFDGQIAELISYSVFPTDAEHNRIQSYLSIKYGITLDNSAGLTAGDYTSAGATNIWDASDYIDYHNDVAGIGRDDVSCLNQKQSQSVNSGSIVAIGLGGIEANNAANMNNFDTDETFMMWGDDGDDASQANANTADLPGNVTERMERIWRVNETNTVGQTTVQFDISGLGYGTNVSDFQLITSSTATMASGSLTPAASLVGNILTFNNVDFADGDFFTIGTARAPCGPGGITNDLTLWLRADSEVFNTGTTTATDGQTVATWADQSGSSADATDGSSLTTYETNTINFNPAIEFDNDATSLEGSFTTTTAGLTLMTAGFINSTSGTTDALFELRGGTSDRSFLINSRYGGNTNYSTNFNEDSWNIWSVDHPSGNSANIFQNGASFESAYNTTLSDAGAGSYNYTLGDDDTGGNDIVGFLGDVIVYQGTLTSTERRQVETYLALKYGVTIDQTSATNYIWSDGSSVLWNGTNNASHNQDIAGIGRDDDSCFSQKQSTSANSDDILSIGLGSVEASNSENSNSFDQNGDYLIWGNDGGATTQASANTSDLPSNLAERMTRVWKAEDTGNVGATELQFDLTGLGYSVADAAAFSLLVGNTATMADATIISGGTLNGNILSFTGIDLTDGQFFTIGTAIETCGPGGVNTNIALWLRADLAVFSDAGSTAANDGDNVLQWNDQSSPQDNGSETNLFGANPLEPTFETNEINFNPVLSFADPNSSNASYIETTSNTVSGDMTLISVFQTGQAAGTQGDFESSPALIGANEISGTLDYGLGMENGQLFLNANTTTGFDVETPATYNNNSPHFVSATRLQSSGALNLYVDSESVASGTGSTSALTDPTSFGIGNHSDGDQDAQFAGDIAESIVFSSVLTANERTRVESYLAIKYGLTRVVASLSAAEQDYLAADGGIIWDYDGQSTTYYNDIFGIGRDDLSCFEQTQSQSENSDALVTFNQSGGFGTNDSFILSGNDNAPIEQENNSEKPSGIDSRLNREWRVQETGTVGSIEVTYDLADITGPLGVGTNNLNLLRLLVDDDGDFNSGATLISPSSVDGTNNTATFTVDFTDGQYYTLGSTEIAALPVTLVSFSVSNKDDKQVQLDWVTAEETNNSFYTIERSANGIDFESIGTQEGSGNSSALLYYQFIDIQPLNGRAFYRLKQTDTNGVSDYSEIKSVYIEQHYTFGFKAFPNPISRGETLKISYRIDNMRKIKLEGVDTKGMIHTSQEIQLNPKQSFIEIFTRNFSKGLNFVRISDQQGKVHVLKLIVR